MCSGRRCPGGAWPQNSAFADDGSKQPEVDSWSPHTARSIEPRLSVWLTLGGELAWTLVYAWALWIGWQERTTAIPWIAVVLNVTWELLFTVIYPSAPKRSRAIYWSWLLLDIALLSQLLWLGPDPALPAWFAEHYRPLVVVSCLVAFAGQWFIHSKTRVPELQAYVLNFVMSALFLQLYAARSDGHGLSLVVAWLKLFGTGAISVANLYAWVLERSVRWLPVCFLGAITAMDILYALLVTLRR